MSEWPHDTESWAVFAQGTFNITDNLSLIAGVRYTEETKEADAQTWLNTTTDAEGLAATVSRLHAYQLVSGRHLLLLQSGEIAVLQHPFQHHQQK